MSELVLWVTYLYSLLRLVRWCLSLFLSQVIITLGLGRLLQLKLEALEGQGQRLYLIMPGTVAGTW